jgi:signal transduction histidine kinase
MALSERLRWVGLPPRIALGFALAIATLATAAVACYAAVTARASASQHVRYTAAARLAIEEVESALHVSRAALDAYLAGGDPRHRERFVRAAGMVEPAFATLRSLSDHVEDAQGVAQLATDVETVQSDHARTQALLDAGDLDAARALAAHGPAPHAIERVMAALDRLEEGEARVHQLREAAWARSVRVLNAVFAAAVSVLLVLVLAGARLVRREMRMREAHAAERERALLVQQRLMAVVSHDLRNPLEVVLAAASALARGNGSPEATRLAGRIVAAGRRMARLVGDVLDWSRVHGGAPIPICARAGDLHELCRRIVDEQADRDASRVRVEGEGDTRAVFDPDRMEQVVGNLLSNALLHGPAGTPVRVRTVGTADEVRVEVEDAGPGVPPEARARIFEPFRREPGASGSGAGLGLFIARALTEAHGGGISLDCARGRTTFVVRLPRGAPEGAPLHAAPAVPPRADCPAFVRNPPSQTHG